MRRRKVAALMVGLLVFAGACGGSDDSDQNADSGDKARGKITSTTEAEETTTTAAGPDQTATPAVMGQPFTVEGLEMTFHAAQIPLSTEGEIFQPVPGTLLIGVDAEVKNAGAAAVEFRPGLALVDAGNHWYNETSTGKDPGPPDGDILPASGKRGIFTFQIPESANAPGLSLVLVTENDAPAIVLPLVPGAERTAAPEADGSADAAKPNALGAAVSSGWAIVVAHAVENPCTPPEQRSPPDAGMRYVTVEMEVFNTTRSNQDGYDLEAELQDATNQTFRSASRTCQLFPEDPFESIPAGFARRGPVVFQIPEASGAGALKLIVTVDDEAPFVFNLT